ncbi:MAG: response regulator [Candidatus Vecturithrix sp.]|jgi:signal transduction histidine kinase|nr:response regulator [Candidatus Vecturithrix sp.]
MSNHSVDSIFIVDDDLQELLLLQRLLEIQMKMPVIAASSGSEALSLFAHETIVFLIIKVELPDISGIEVARQMRRKQGHQETPILFVTSSGLSEELNFPEFSSGVVDYFLTPIHTLLFLHRVTAYLHLRERNRLELDLHSLQQQLQEVRQHKNNFILNMSHELRTPLNAMIGYTSLTLKALRHKIAPEFIENLGKAERSARHLLQLINDILDFSKIEAGKVEIFPEDLDIAEMLEEVAITAEEFLAHKQLEFYQEIASDLPIIESDYTKLKQILDNLMNNAIKFTSTGSVTVRARTIPEKAVVRLEIEDTGEGIAEEKIESIFELFKQGDSSFKKKFAGTGLGLAITKSFCDMLGIEIGVESVLGKGTVFWLHIPSQVSDDQRQAMPEDTSRKKELKHETTRKTDVPAKAFESILIIDDDAMNLNLHETIFEAAGYTVYTAKSGMEGLVMLRKTLPDVILMDLAMPDMDGFEVTQRIKQDSDTSDIPVIACSAFASRESQQQAIEIGCAGYITKPISPERLVAQVAKILSTIQES